MTISAYPLTWPDTMPRTKTPMRSQFKTSLNSALENVRGSLRRFSADSNKGLTELVISSNVTLGTGKPSDPGVAVWFTWDSMQVCIAVDRYPTVEANLQAIHHIIEARRTELRHGGLAIVRATFQGFRALPSPDSKRPWRDVLGFASSQFPSRSSIQNAYLQAARRAHPDAGGSTEKMQEVSAAKEEALKEIGAA